MIPSESVRVHDHREVTIPLPAGLTSWTPAGRVPIACKYLQLSYDIATGELGSVEIRGYLKEQRDIDRRARTLRSYGRERASTEIMVRRYRVDWRVRPHSVDAPDWVLAYVEQHRPLATGASS